MTAHTRIGGSVPERDALSRIPPSGAGTGARVRSTAALTEQEVVAVAAAAAGLIAGVIGYAVAVRRSRRDWRRATC